MKNNKKERIHSLNDFINKYLKTNEESNKSINYESIFDGSRAAKQDLESLPIEKLNVKIN